MSNFEGTYISNTFKRVIQVGKSDNSGIDTTLRNLQDGMGNNLPIQFSTTELAGITTEKIIYVSKGSNATDTRSGLNKYDSMQPFATVTSAVAAATSGDTVTILPGIHEGSNIAKTGVNLFLYGGAIIRSTTGTASVVDDSSTGTNADIICSISGGGSLESDLRNLPVIKITRAGSIININLKSLTNFKGASTSNASVITQNQGTVYITADTIIAGGEPLTWSGGVAYIEAKYIKSLYSYAIWGTGLTSASSHWHIRANLVEAGVPIAIGGSYGRAWINIDRVLSTGDTIIAIGGDGIIPGPFVYLTAQKLDCSIPCESALIQNNDATLYLTAQKIEGGLDDATAYGFDLTGTLSKSFIHVGQFLDTGSDVEAAIINVEGGEHVIKIDTVIRTYVGHGVQISGGTLRLSGIINTTVGTTSNPIVKSGGTLILDNVALIAHPSSKSISSATSQTVKIYGTSVANVDVHSNITTTIGTLIVDPTVT